MSLPPGWSSGNIRRFAQMKTGHTPSRTAAEYWENTTIPWFTLADVWQLRDGHQIYLGDTRDMISALGLQNSAADLLPAGTVVLSRTASVGFSGIMPKAMATSQDFWNWVCGPELLPEYLNYQFKSMAPQLRSLNMGSTHQTIYQKDAAAICVTVPPVQDQRAIVGFLDRETARIDMLIAKQEQLIKSLRERADSVWAAVFAGLVVTAPNVQVRRMLESIVDGPFGSSLTSAHYSESGARVIRLGNIGINEFRDQDTAYVPLDYANELSAHSALPGDVIIAGLGDNRMPLGRAAVLPDIGPAIVKADCYRARPVEAVRPEYLAWALSAPQTRGQIALLARGATRARLNTNVVREVVLPLPSISTQRDAVAKTKVQISKIDTLIARAEEFIALSKERRSALITAAVTGQIDVRDKVA